MNIEVSIYSTSSGKEPYSDWEDSLDAKVRAIITTRLDRIKEGNFGDVTPVKGAKGIWEIRFDYGPGYRIYYGKVNTKVILLLVGGDKKCQTRDIGRAKRYWLDCKE